MAAEKYRHILLTGMPGVGKTTMIMKTCDIINSKNIPATGFYTKEVREGTRRKGFDVVTLDGSCSILSRIRECMPEYKRKSCPTVGQYLVDVNSFEGTSINALQLRAGKYLYIVDEIGKMELFSQQFKDAVMKVFNSNQAVVLGTIPVTRGKPLPLVEELRNRKDVKVFTVTKENRDHLLQDVCDTVLAALS